MYKTQEKRGHGHKDTRAQRHKVTRLRTNKDTKSFIPLCLCVFVSLFFFSLLPLMAEEPSQEGSSLLTLEDCYRLALKQSETIAINKDLIAEAESKFVQAFGTVLPHFSYSSSDTYQDKSGLTTTESGHAYERKLVLKQTLFSGFKEFAAMSGSRSEYSQRTYEKDRAEQLLWRDVAFAFYLFLEQQEDLKELQKTTTTLQDRIKELEDRQRIGRSRKSEIVNTQAQLYSIEANITQIESQVRVVRDLLEFLTGTKISGVRDSEEGIPPLNMEDVYLGKAEDRLDVLALRQAWEVAKRQMDVARSGLLPTVTAEGGYYLKRNTDPTVTEWDFLLKVDVPIFQGTETYGAIMQARLKAHQSELLLKRSKRISEAEVRDAYALAVSAVANCLALRKASEATEENYRLQKADYQNGLVNNLDVLVAIQQVQEARRNYIHGLYAAKRYYWQLLVAAGMTPKEN